MNTDAITIENLSTNTFLNKDGVQLSLNVFIKISEADEDVALMDASNIQSVLIDFVKNFIKDYAADGQEVE